MSAYEAVVFDKDGTLIDVHLTWGPVFAQVVPAIAGADAALVAEALGLGLADATLASDSPIIAGSNADIARIIGDVLARPAAEVLAELEPRIEALAAAAAHPLPATADVLQSLSATGVWQGLATNDGEVAAERQLEHLGWRGHFASVLGYDSGFGGKPDPGMLVESARRADVAAEALLFVGDSETDRRTAAAAGCPFLFVGPDDPLERVLAMCGAGNGDSTAPSP